MSNTVDQKVVEMRFDNRQFEANVKQSMTTLDKLQNSLKLTESAKGLEEVEKASEKVTFDEMSNSLTTVQAKFSALQVAGITAISRLTNSAMDAANKIKSYTIGAITEGGKSRALNIEQAKFQFKGLKMNVEKSMNSALEAVKGTAYGLDEAAMVASQLGASGMKAGDEMTRSLRAVSGVAAMTGSSYSDIGRIFTQTAGQGRLMGDQLLQISQRGINAAATISQYLNKNEKDVTRVRESMKKSGKKAMKELSKQTKYTEADIRAMVSAGVIDFQTFSNAMDDAFGAHAKDANKTFSGALSNVKAALSRLGADFATPSFSRARKILNNLIPTIDGIHDSLQPVIGDFEKFIEIYGKKVVRGLRKVNGEINRTVTTTDFKDLEKNGIVTKTFIKALKKTAKEHNVNVDEIMKNHKSFRGTLKEGWLTLDILNESLTKYKKSLDSTSEKVSKNGKKHSDFTKKQRKELKSLAKQAKATGTPLNQLISRMNRMTKMELIVDTLRNVRKSIQSIIKPIKQAYKEIFPTKNEDAIYSFLDGLHNLSEKMILNEESADKLRRSFSGLFAVVDILRTISTGALTIGLRILAQVFGLVNVNVLDVTAAVGDALVKFREWLYSNETIKKVIDTFVDTIAKAIEKVTEWFSLLKDSPAIKEIVSELIDYLTKGFKSISKYVGNGSDKITSFFEALSKMNVDDIKKKVEDAFSNIKSTLFGFPKDLGGTLDESKSKISSFTDFVQDKIGVDLNQVFRIGGAIGLIKILTDALKKIESPLESVGKLIKNTGGAVKSVRRYIDFKRSSAKFVALFTLAKAIAVVAASVAVLASLPADRVHDAFRFIALMGAGLVGMLIAINKLKIVGMDSLKSFSITAKQILAFAGALFILVLAIKKLQGVKLKNVGQGLITLLAELTLMIGSILVISKLAGRASVGLTTIIGMAASMYILAGALQKLDAIEWNHFGETLGTMALLLGGLAVVLLATSVTGKSAAGARIAALSIAGAMYILIEVINKIDNLELENPKKVVAGMLLLIFGITTVLKAMGKAGNNAASAGLGMLAISGAIYLLVEVIKELNYVRWGTALKGIVVIGVLLVAIRGVIESMAMSNKYAIRAGIAMIAVSGAIAILALVASYLGNIPLVNLLKGTLAVVSLLGMIALILKMSENATDAKTTLISIAAVVAILAGSIYVIAKLDPAKAAVGTACIGALLALVAGITRLCKELPKEALITMGILTAIVAALAGVIWILSTKCGDVSNVIGITASLTTLLIGIAATMAIVSAIPIGAALNGIGSLAIAIAGIAGILAALGAIEKLTKGKLSSLLGSGGDIMQKIGEAIGKFVGGIIGGVAEAVFSTLPNIGIYLSDFMVNLTPFISGLKLFDKDLAKSALYLAEVLLCLGAAEIISAIANMFGADYSAIKQLTEFGIGVVAYSTAIKSLKAKDIERIKTSAEAAKPLTEVANAIPLIGGFLGDLVGNRDLGVFGKQLAGFGRGIKAYSESVQNLKVKDIKRIKTSAEAAKPLTEVAQAVPLIGGALSAVVGDRDLGKFGNQLGSFGTGLKTYSDSVKDLTNDDIEQIKTSAEVSKGLVDLANGLPTTGGFVEWFTGNKTSLDTFGDQLTKYGKGLKSYADSVSSITDDDIDKVKSSISISNSLVDIVNGIPSEAAFWGVFGGDKDLDGFSKDVESFGTGLANYATTLGSLGEKDVSNSEILTEMVKTLIDAAILSHDADVEGLLNFIKKLSEDLPLYFVKMSNGLNGAFGKSDEITKIVEIIRELVTITQVAQNTKPESLVYFSNALPTVADNIAQYYKTLEVVEPTTLKNISEAITTILDYVSNTVVKMGNAKKNVKSFINLIPKVATGIIDYYNEIKQINSKDLLKKTESTKTFLDTLSEISTDGIEAFTSNFSDSKEPKSAIGKFIQAVNNVANNKKDSVKTSFETIGKHIVSGFVTGVNNDTFKVKDAMEKMAEEAVKAAKKKLKIKSPSRVFKEIAKFVIDGYVKGIIDNTDKAISVTTNSIKKIIDAASKEMIVGKKVMESFVNGFFGDYKKTLKNTSGIKALYQTASEAVTKYAESLYKESDSYKTDQKNLKKHKEELAKSEKELKKYQEKRSKYSTKNRDAYKKNEKQLDALENKRDNASKKEKKRIDSQIKNLKKQNKALKSNASKEEKAVKELDKKIQNAKKSIKSAKQNIKKDAKDVQSHIKSSLTSVVSDISDSLKSYMDPFQQSLETGISLFETFEHQSKISSNKVLYNMRSQIEGVSKWKENLSELASKGIAQGLIDQLKEQGVTGNSTIEAFLKMSSEQIKEANDLYNKSTKLSFDTWMENVDDVQMTSAIWSENIKTLAKKGLSQDAIEALGSLGVESSAPYIEALLSASNKDIKKFNKKYASYLKLDDAVANSVVASYAYAGSKAEKALSKKLSKKQAKKISKNVCDGLVEGLSKNKETVINTCTSLGKSMLKSLNKSLDIHSPSRETEKSGYYFTSGLSVGILDKLEMVKKSAETVGNTALDSLTETISKVPDLVEEGIDADMVIRPVLDLSDVTDKTAQMNAMFSRKKAMRISSQISSNTKTLASSNEVGNNAGTVINHNYTQNISSPKYLSRIDIYRDTRRLVNQHA